MFVSGASVSTQARDNVSQLFYVPTHQAISLAWFLLSPLNTLQASHATFSRKLSLIFHPTTSHLALSS